MKTKLHTLKSGVMFGSRPFTLIGCRTLKLRSKLYPWDTISRPYIERFLLYFIDFRVVDRNAVSSGVMRGHTCTKDYWYSSTERACISCSTPQLQEQQAWWLAIPGNNLGSEFWILLCLDLGEQTNILSFTKCQITALDTYKHSALYPESQISRWRSQHSTFR